MVTAYILNQGFCEIFLENNNLINFFGQPKQVNDYRMQELIMNANYKISPAYSEIIGIIEYKNARGSLYRDGKAVITIWSTQQTFSCTWYF